MLYLATSMLPVMKTSFPFPLAEKHDATTNLSDHKNGVTQVLSCIWFAFGLELSTFP